jgi:hypothetical protein
VLSHDTFALVENYTATLQIYRIVEEPESDTSLRTLVRLGLPHLASSTRISSSDCIQEQMSVYSDGPSFVVEGRPPRRHPFHTSPDERIVTFSIQLQDPFDHDHDPWDQSYSYSFAIVTHIHTLIAHATTALPKVNFIPWKDWGPSGTACFEGYIDSRRNACVVGERLATLSHRGLSVFDFNPTRVKNAIRKAGHLSENKVYSVVKDRVVILKEGLFEMDVVSELPYVSVTMPAPSRWERVHTYEEVLAGSRDVRGRLFLSFVALGIDSYQTDRAEI